MSERIFRTGEVWLYRCDLNGLEEREITAISGGFVQHCKGCSKSWCSAMEWNSKAQTKLGTVRRFLGIRFGINPK